jgi:hypothetical protein
VPEARRQARRAWVVAVSVAVAVHLGGLLLFPVAPLGRGERPRFEPRVFWAGAAREESMVAQEMELIDSAPLFLPTRWNFTGGSTRPGGERPPGDIFEEGPAKLPLTEQAGDGPPPGLDLLPAAVATAAQAVREFPWPPLEAVGREDLVPIALEARGAMLEFRSLETGELTLAMPVPAAAVPSAAWADWAPFDLVLSIDETGIVALPLIAQTSGSGAADAFFREYLGGGFRAQLRLRPGTYRVTVGP